MSSATDVVQTRSSSQPSSWGLWLRQIGAIFRLEIEKNFLSRRSLLIYLLAFLPLFPLSILALVRPPHLATDVGLVDFNRPAKASGERRLLHRLTNPMGHEPRGLVRHAEHPV